MSGTAVAGVAVQRTAVAALLLGATAVAASPVFVRLTDLTALPSAFYRPFLAIPIAWIWMAATPAAAGGARRHAADWRDRAGLLLAGTFFAGDLAFWHLSIHHTTVANATLFANSAPIFVVVLGWLLFRRRVTRTFLVGLALAVLGAAALAGGSIRIAPENLIGDAYGVATALFLACYLMALERLRATYTSATALTWTSTGTAAVLLPVALLTGEPMVSQTLHGWLMLAALALVSHLVGQGLIIYAMAHLPVSFTAVALLFETVAAAGLAALILGEDPTAWQFAGGAIILSGIAIARRGSQ